MTDWQRQYEWAITSRNKLLEASLGWQVKAEGLAQELADLQALHDNTLDHYAAQARENFELKHLIVELREQLEVAGRRIQTLVDRQQQEQELLRMTVEALRWGLSNLDIMEEEGGDDPS